MNKPVKCPSCDASMSAKGYKSHEGSTKCAMFSELKADRQIAHARGYVDIGKREIPPWLRPTKLAVKYIGASGRKSAFLVKSSFLPKELAEIVFRNKSTKKRCAELEAHVFAKLGVAPKALYCDDLNKFIYGIWNPKDYPLLKPIADRQFKCTGDGWYLFRKDGIVKIHLPITATKLMINDCYYRGYRIREIYDAKTKAHEVYTKHGYELGMLASRIDVYMEEEDKQNLLYFVSALSNETRGIRHPEQYETLKTIDDFLDHSLMQIEAKNKIFSKLARVERLIEKHGYGIDYTNRLAYDVSGELGNYHIQHHSLLIFFAKNIASEIINAFNLRKAQKIASEKVQKANCFVEFDDSLKAGNCYPITEKVREELTELIGAQGEFAVHAQELLKFRNDSYSQRAVAAALLRQEKLAEARA